MFGRKGAALQKPCSEAMYTATFHKEMWGELGYAAWRRQGWGWEMYLNLAIYSQRWVIVDSQMMGCRQSPASLRSEPEESALLLIRKEVLA